MKEFYKLSNDVNLHLIGDNTNYLLLKELYLMKDELMSNYLDSKTNYLKLFKDSVIIIKFINTPKELNINERTYYHVIGYYDIEDNYHEVNQDCTNIFFNEFNNIEKNIHRHYKIRQILE